MLQKTFATGIAMLCLLPAFAQTAAPSDSLPPQSKLTVSGSADAYYRYDFAKTSANNKTSFTNSHNSAELGMASVKLEHTGARTSMVADLGFGKRAEEFSYNDDRTRFIIKQLYLSYAFKNNLKLTAGSWATHVGYELVDAYANRNYSMSYMFSYGPFFHTGLKAEKTFGKFGVMLGIANPTDLKSTSLDNKYVIGQLSLASPNDKVKAWLNFQAGNASDSLRVSQVDLVLTTAISSKFNLGLNGTMANFQQKDADKSFGPAESWWGAAAYLNFDPAAWLGLTLRSELFSDDQQLNVFGAAPAGGTIFANTLSATLKKENLIVIPELRFEKASEDIYVKSPDEAGDTSMSVLLAMLYKF